MGQRRGRGVAQLVLAQRRGVRPAEAARLQDALLQQPLVEFLAVVAERGRVDARLRGGPGEARGVRREAQRTGRRGVAALLRVERPGEVLDLARLPRRDRLRRIDRHAVPALRAAEHRPEGGGGRVLTVGVLQAPEQAVGDRSVAFGVGFEEGHDAACESALGGGDLGGVGPPHAERRVRRRAAERRAELVQAEPRVGQAGAPGWSGGDTTCKAEPGVSAMMVGAAMAAEEREC